MSVLRRRPVSTAAPVAELIYQFPTDSTYGRLAIDTLRANVYLCNNTSLKIEKLNLADFTVNRAAFSTPIAGRKFASINYNAVLDEMMVGVDFNGSAVYLHHMDGSLKRQFGSFRYSGHTVYHNGTYVGLDFYNILKAYNSTGGSIKNYPLVGNSQVTMAMDIHEGKVYTILEGSTHYLYTLNVTDPMPDAAVNTGISLSPAFQMVVTPNGYVCLANRATLNNDAVKIYKNSGEQVDAILSETCSGITYYNGALYAVTSAGKLYRYEPIYTL